MPDRKRCELLHREHDDPLPLASCLRTAGVLAANEIARDEIVVPTLVSTEAGVEDAADELDRADNQSWMSSDLMPEALLAAHGPDGLKHKACSTACCGSARSWTSCPARTASC